MNRRLITRRIILILPVLVVLTGLGCSSPVGTWTVDVKKTLDSVETIPKGLQETYKDLQSYKKWLAGEIDGLELTFTTEREVVHPGLFSKGCVMYVVNCTQGNSTRTIYWTDDKKYSLWRFVWMSGPSFWPEGEFVLGDDTAAWQKQNMMLPRENEFRYLGVSGCFKRKSFWSRGLTFYQKLIVGITIWTIAHLALFVIGFVGAKPRLLGRWARWPGVVSQLASWILAACIVVFGFTCIRAIFWQPGPALIWLFVASSPLCCFATGLAYGLTRKKTRLLPLALLVIGVGITMIALFESFFDGLLI